MSEELKPCPFCGGEPIRSDENDGMGAGMIAYWVSCKSCKSSSFATTARIDDETKRLSARQRADEAWNIRTDNTLDRVRELRAWANQEIEWYEKNRVDDDERRWATVCLDDFLSEIDNRFPELAKQKAETAG